MNSLSYVDPLNANKLTIAGDEGIGSSTWDQEPIINPERLKLYNEVYEFTISDQAGPKDGNWVLTTDHNRLQVKMTLGKAGVAFGGLFGHHITIDSGVPMQQLQLAERLLYSPAISAEIKELVKRKVQEGINPHAKYIYDPLHGGTQFEGSEKFQEG